MTNHILVCSHLDSNFLEEATKFNMKAGSTLLFSLIHNGHFSIANIGDSVGYVLKDNGYLMKKTIDHTPDRTDEYTRLAELGSLITTKNGVKRVEGELTVTRAIGDLDHKNFIISEPEVTTAAIEEDDDLLILSSDGILRVYDEQTFALKLHQLRQIQRAQGLDLSFISRCLLDEACQNFYCRDNVSLVIIDLAKHLVEYRTSQQASIMPDRKLHQQFSMPFMPPVNY